MNIPNIANQKVVGFDHFKFRVNNNAFGNAPHETIVKHAFPPNPLGVAKKKRCASDVPPPAQPFFIELLTAERICILVTFKAKRLAI